MSDASPLLALPYILPAQAQKHVTHNEAIRALDAIVQLSVADRTRTAPPPEPAAGDRHLVAAGATGAWSGQDGKVALWAEDAGWLFLAPRPGWLAWVEDEALLVVRSSAGWTEVLSGVQDFDQLGISATPDATNRLSVSSPASLFTHDGAGHQIKVNKAAATDTASLMFQTGYSGRAEIGTAGSDDFAVKVSADGTTWHSALTADRSTGRLTAPAGLDLPSGTAAAPGLAHSGDADSGLYFPAANQVALAAGGTQALLASSTALTAPLPVRLPSGTETAPGLAFTGDTDTGFYRPSADTIDVTAASTARMRISSGGVRLGSLLTDATGIGGTLLVQHTTASARVTVARYAEASSAVPATLVLCRSRSDTAGSFDPVESGDRLGEIYFNGADGTNLATIGALVRSTATATATTGDVRANLQLVTRGADGLQPRLTITPSTTVGIGTASPTTTLHVAGPVRVGGYTVATVPSASASGAGAIIYIADASGGDVLAYSDGTTWRRCTDRTVVS